MEIKPNLASFRKVFHFFSYQFLLQAVTFAIGIFLIRNVSPQEYAIYFLFLSLFSATSIIGSGGLNTAFYKIAGPLIVKKDAIGDNPHFIHLDGIENNDIDTPLNFEIAEFFYNRAK